MVHLHGSPKDKSISAIVSDYARRLRSRGISLETHPDRHGSKRYESELTDLPGSLVLLDESGETKTSLELAKWLSSIELDRGPTNLAVGSSEGFSDSLKERADYLIALSAMTLSHELAAAVLMEQLFRASEINRGTPYHRE
ncbi:MAG: 23S rRNA (pseudouridine(1915)-N(3))-methyltransferase RlmH [Candidatus Thalassarchaeaceae archaeon]|jgi:23S rRNA (pseudouridine1915-N3)-methyltransferase|nr:23S rRNA (pseudouridine(1915)-N(3))-methyltransferase RlmH [Candidatus Thalassarchaeaceae archaeon]MDP6703175.1 23S rRNA (pseudouridine(1915)-N(3))-methyltransferase RlmH [Candidatus Thalassarchaeaceae archaeon]MDP7003820.1 23S rRNA (pseudouridine(1915)-N(3))-methyltransferase RlmH [Candidatus Thalassarchaeaceae archaeon]